MNGRAVANRLRELARLARVATTRVLGVPDYDAYIEHLARAHPGAKPLRRGQFMRERLDARYSKVGARCC